MAATVPILTPKRTGKTGVARYLLPYQIKWVNDESPSKLGEKSRQIGWTWCEAFDAVSRRFRRTQPRDVNYWYSSADESAGAEFISYCEFFARKLFSNVADKFEEHVEDEDARKGYVTALGIRCPNGTRITAMSSNPRRFRGKRGDVRVDECAVHDDPAGMHDAASPVTQWGGTYATWSTHFGEGSLFNNFVKTSRRILMSLGLDPDASPLVAYEQLEAAAINLGVSPVFSYHRVTIVDAIDQGLVEKINAVTDKSVTREQFMQRIRLKVRNIDALNQEYLCIASSDATAWLPYKLIESCEHPDVPQPGDAGVRFTGGRVVAGCDVGRTRNLTYVPFCEELGDVLWPRVIVVLRNMPITEQVRIIANEFRKANCTRICVDKTGVGIGLVDGLVEELGSHAVEGIDLNNPNKERLAIKLLEAFEDKHIRISENNQKQRDSLHSIRKEYTATGKPRFVAPNTDEGHADDFWGLALAVESAGQETYVAPNGIAGRPSKFATRREVKFVNGRLKREWI